MHIRDRAAAHAALGDERRLLVVEELFVTDLTFAELAKLTGMPGNLLAHHLGILEQAGLIKRTISEGDHRRKYVSLRRGWAFHSPAPVDRPRSVLFVCTHNSARSQFAAAMWEARTRGRAQSAGTDPASRIHPEAIAVAAEMGIGLEGRVTRGYDEVEGPHDWVVSVCDRARESGAPKASRSLHWSVPDPVAIGTTRAFRDAFTAIASRIESLGASMQR